jgi:hypothetical protein
MHLSRVLPLLLGAASLVGCGGATISPHPATDAAADAAADARVTADAALSPDAPIPPDAPATSDASVTPDTARTDASPADVSDVPATPDASVTTDAAHTDASPADVSDASNPLVPCSEVASLTRDPVQVAQIARVAGGLVVAWYPYGGGGVAVQGFSESFAPRGTPLSLPLFSNGTDGISLSFWGGTGVMTAGSSLYFLTLSADLTLTLANRIDFPRRIVRHAHMASATVAHAVFADGRYVVTDSTGMGGSALDSAVYPPHGPAVSIAPTQGGYVSLEPRDIRGIRLLHARRFVFGHGASIEVMNTYIDGVSASPVAASGDALLRLVTYNVREVDVALERRGLADFAAQGEPIVLQRGAAWGETSGAIDASGSDAFVAWAAHPAAGGNNSAARAMWASERASTEVFRHVRDVPVRVLGAASDAAMGRGWVLLGLDGNGTMHSLHGRCVDRAR